MNTDPTGPSVENNAPSVESEQMSFISRLPNFMRRRLRDNTDLTQNPEFGWDASMVTDNSRKAAEQYQCDMGLQASVEFDGTDFRKSFDESVAALRSFAQRGTEQTGWRHASDEEKNPGNLYGQLNVVIVNGREYQVIEETRSDAHYPSVSIRGTSEKGDDNQWHNKDSRTGAYYFTGVVGSGKNTVGTRKLEICGARMSIDEVQSDIQEIIKIAKGSQVS